MQFIKNTATRTTTRTTITRKLIAIKRKQVVHDLNQVKILQAGRRGKTLGKKMVAFWIAHLTYTHFIFITYTFHWIFQQWLKCYYSMVGQKQRVDIISNQILLQTLQSKSQSMIPLCRSVAAKAANVWLWDVDVRRTEVTVHHSVNAPIVKTQNTQRRISLKEWMSPTSSWSKMMNWILTVE